LRARKETDGIRGYLANAWDGSQGWLLVTIIGTYAHLIHTAVLMPLSTGFATACIAYLIISSEMLLFDLKEGYCSTDIFQPKRFCCRKIVPLQTINPYKLWAIKPTGAMSTTSFLKGWSASSNVEACENWRTWGQVWNGRPAGGVAGGDDDWAVDYFSFIAIAVSLLPFHLYPH
jgi:chloride channel 3/4/5